MLGRYSLSLQRLAKILSTPIYEIRKYKAEFIASAPFSAPYAPFRNTDQFKAMILYVTCRVRKPRVVVETGVAAGHSSLGILTALSMNGWGQLFSIDYPGATYRTDSGGLWKDTARTEGPGWLVPENLRDRWTLRLGPSHELLPELIGQLRTIDFFYHDSEHTYRNMTFELETCWAALNPGSPIVVDNVDWSGAFQSFCRNRQLSSCIVFPFLGVTSR